ncbi:MAG: PilZ domain-containing protein [Planctomycetota bacterium]
MSDRRDGGARHAADLPAKLCDERSARFYPCRVRDVSSGGFRLVVPPTFSAKPGAELFLHVADGKSGVTQRVDMRPVRVAWRMQIEDHGGYAIGVERTDMEQMSGVRKVSTRALAA